MASVKKGRSETFKYYFGGGISVYDLSGALEYASKTAASYLTPTVAFRMEYFPQKRVGVSLSGCVDLISKIAKEHTIAGVSDNARLSSFYLEPSISVYF